MVGVELIVATIVSVCWDGSPVKRKSCQTAINNCLGDGRVSFERAYEKTLQCIAEIKEVKKEVKTK